jgi:CRISPR-associated endonuclease Csn1
VQYVKEKLFNGKWQFKLNKDGHKIPLIAKGDSIRGQLHKESFFGAIKIKGELSLVERYSITSFTSIADCKNIVDLAVRALVESTLQVRMQQGLSFDQAKTEPIPFDSGKTVIKKVRCKVAAGRGYLTPEKALEIRQHTYPSKHEYKNSVYAQNDQNTFCLYYELEENGKVHRAFRILGLFELAKLGLSKESDLYLDNYYNKFETGKGEKIRQLPLTYIIKNGLRVIFYKEHIEELKDLNRLELLKRIYRVYKFNSAPSDYVYCQNHLEARNNDALGKGDNELNFEKYQSRVFLTASKLTAAFEGKDFEILPDGDLRWL